MREKHFFLLVSSGSSSTLFRRFLLSSRVYARVLFGVSWNSGTEEPRLTWIRRTSSNARRVSTFSPSRIFFVSPSHIYPHSSLLSTHFRSTIERARRKGCQTRRSPEVSVRPEASPSAQVPTQTTTSTSTTTNEQDEEEDDETTTTENCYTRGETTSSFSSFLFYIRFYFHFLAKNWTGSKDLENLCRYYTAPLISNTTSSKLLFWSFYFYNEIYFDFNGNNFCRDNRSWIEKHRQILVEGGIQTEDYLPLKEKFVSRISN